MNLSKWSGYTETERRGFMVVIKSATQSHVMPPSRYLWMHPEARLSAEELDCIRNWTLTTDKSK